MHSPGFTPNKYLESHPVVYGCHFTVFRGTIPAFPSERCGSCICTFFYCLFALKLMWLCRQVSGDGKAQQITSSAWKAAVGELTMGGRCRQRALLRVQQSTTTYSEDSACCPGRLLLLRAATSTEAALTGASLKALSALARPFPWIAPPSTSPYHAKQKQLDAFLSSCCLPTDPPERALAPARRWFSGGFSVLLSAPTLAQRYCPSCKSTPHTLLLLQPHALCTNNPRKRRVLRSFPAPRCGPLAPRGSSRAVSRSGTVPLPPCGTRSEGRGRCAAGSERTRLRTGTGTGTSSARTAPQPEGGARPLVTAAVRSEAGPGPRGAGQCPAELPYLGPRSRRSDRYQCRPPSAAPAAAPCCGRGPSPSVPGAESAGGSAPPGNEEPERPRRPGRPVPSRVPGRLLLRAARGARLTRPGPARPGPRGTRLPAPARPAPLPGSFPATTRNFLRSQFIPKGPESKRARPRTCRLASAPPL